MFIVPMVVKRRKLCHLGFFSFLPWRQVSTSENRFRAHKFHGRKFAEYYADCVCALFLIE